MNHEPSQNVIAPPLLVLGDGPYAAALAMLLGAPLLLNARLHADPPAAAAQTMAWQTLQHVFLIVSENEPMPAVMQRHRRLWEWVDELARPREFHKLAFVFLIHPSAPEGAERAIASYLCLDPVELPANGHAAWRRSGSLWDLLHVAQNIRPKDHDHLKARLDTDIRRISLRNLLQSLNYEDPRAAAGAAHQVIAAFAPAMYHLDYFCRQPNHHLHGHALRRWIQAGVDGAALQAWLREGQEQLPRWLDVAVVLDAG